MTRTQNQGPYDHHVANRLGAELVNDRHVDVVIPALDLELQVKACQRWRQSGTMPNGEDKRQRGQFRVWERELDYLQTVNGAYVFVVYDGAEPLTWDDVLAWRWAAPHEVRAAATGWHDAHRAGKGRTAYITWTELVEVDA